MQRERRQEAACQHAQEKKRREKMEEGKQRQCDEEEKEGEGRKNIVENS